jgi:predicted RNA-binding protein with PIN domain/Skp family chaperone for outer membrane proteins
VTAPLPDPVRSRVVALTADALGRMEPEHLPASLKRVAAFAPARRARLAGTQIAGVLAQDDGFRERVAVQVRAEVPDLVRALDAPEDSSQPDPVDLAAVAYLLRPDGWAEIVSAATAATTAGPVSGDVAVDRVERLRRQLDAVTEQLKDVRRRHREQVADLKAQNTDLRRKLGEARSRVRSAESQAERTASSAQGVASVAAARSSEQEAELRRLRARTEQLERDLATVRRVGRTGRGTETMRARLLLDTLLETAQGLRRELALPASNGSPADAVEALSAEQGTRASSGQASLASEDPALLDQLLALPRAHLIVDGYNVTKTAWPELSLERQRDRLLRGLAPLAARSGAEVTVVFDAADVTDRPLVNRPRGVRVLYSSPGVIADDVIRDLVEAEPRGRPVVVVSSDAEVVRDVLLAGARTASAPALSRLLARS